MKTLITFISVIGFVFITNTFQERTTLQDIDQETKIILVESVDEVKHLSDQKQLTVEVSNSLNLATKKTIKKKAIEKLKAKAASKGYTHLFIEETKGGMSVSKRNYKVVAKGVAYK